MHVGWLAVISMLALTGAAAAAPTDVTHTAWMAGRLEHVDLARHAMVVRQGTHAFTLVLAPDVDVREGARAVTPRSLMAGVGRPVRVRYAPGAGGRVADIVEVLASPGDQAAPDREASGAPGTGTGPVR